jgi:hypothetical protein
MSTRDWFAIHRLITDCGGCLDDLHTSPEVFKGATGPEVVGLLEQAVRARKIVVVRVKQDFPWQHRQIAWEKSHEIGSYDAQCAVIVRLASATYRGEKLEESLPLVLVVDAGGEKLQAWYYYTSKNEADKFMAKANELGVEMVPGENVVLPSYDSVYDMPKRQGTIPIEYFRWWTAPVEENAQQQREV